MSYQGWRGGSHGVRPGAGTLVDADAPAPGKRTLVEQLHYPAAPGALVDGAHQIPYVAPFQGASKLEVDGNAVTPQGRQSAPVEARSSALSTPHAPSEQNSNAIQRARTALAIAEADANTISSTLVPAYKNARDAKDTGSVGEIGGALLGAFCRMHGAKAALDELRSGIRHQSVIGTSVDADLENYRLHQDIAAGIQTLDQKLLQAGTLAMVAMVPHEFRGESVAGVSPSPDMRGTPTELRARLAGELDRTLEMLGLVEDISKLVGGAQKGLDRDALDRSSSQLSRWASRPIDLAFLKAALGWIWHFLDANTRDGRKPSEALATAKEQAQHTGWTGEIGEFSIDEARMWLTMGGQEEAFVVLKKLYTANPDTRARLLMQMKERGLLSKLCVSLGWRAVKELHDGLGFGFGEIKTDLQSFFIGGKDLYGPSLGSEWESHQNSLHHHLGRLPVVGGAVNFVYDLATFGFHSSYGKNRDAFTSGEIGEADYANHRRHLVNRTAAMAFASIVTGGAADKLVRGGAASVGAARAIGGGVAGGSAGAVSGLVTSDAYNIQVSGQQQGFSSPEDYVKTALVGGAFGGVLGGVAHGLSRRARAHVPDDAMPGDVARKSEAASPAPPTEGAQPPERAQAAESAPATEHAQAVTTESVPTPRTRELGLRNETVAALESFENIKRNPLGEINRDPNHNHFKAARREARGEVIVRRSDGRPFDHIHDLQVHYNGLNNARQALEFEIRHPSPTMTDRGLEVLFAKHKELQEVMSRLKGFLDGIGQGPPFPPFHEWPPGS